MQQSTAAMELIISISSLQAHFLKKIDGQLSIHGISFNEYLVMHYLNKATKKTMRRIDLADSIGLSASGVTRLLIPMEKIKLIQKEVNPRDARVSLVKLSIVGEQIYSESSLSFEQSSISLTQVLNSKQIKAFLDLSKSLL